MLTYIDLRAIMKAKESIDIDTLVSQVSIMTDRIRPKSLSESKIITQIHIHLRNTWMTLSKMIDMYSLVHSINIDYIRMRRFLAQDKTRS